MKKIKHPGALRSKVKPKPNGINPHKGLKAFRTGGKKR